MRARGEPGRKDDLRAEGLAEVQDHSGHRPFTGRFLPAVRGDPDLVDARCLAHR